MTIRRWAAVTFLAIVAGCAQVSQVPSGETVVGERMSVQVAVPWNRFERSVGDDRPTWTLEGMAVDTLKFYVGVKDGELVAPTPPQPKGVKPLPFKATMGAGEVVELFQSLWTRDGSTFALERVQPGQFAGGAGFRFDFELVRKRDDVRLRGIAWGAVRNGELHMIVYTAPRLGFFARGVGGAEAIAQSARIRS